MDTGIKGWQWRSPSAADIIEAGPDQFVPAFRKALADIAAGKPANVTLTELDLLAQRELAKAQEACILFASLRAEVKQIHDPVRKRCILCEDLFVNDQNVLRQHLVDDHKVSYVISDKAIDNTFVLVNLKLEDAS